LYSFIPAEEDIMQQFTDTGRIEPIFKDGKYANRSPAKKVNAWDAFRSRANNKAKTEPSKFLPADSIDFAKAFPENKDGLYITWLGHSSLMMQIDGVRVLIDPVFSNNISPVPLFGVRRFQKKPPLSAENMEDLPFIDAVFISHDHYDHLDRQAIAMLEPNVGFFLAPLGVGSILRDWGIDSAKVREYAWWQEGGVKGLSGQILNFACTPSHHFSGRSPFNRNGTLWASWVFRGAVHKVFYSGDTGYDLHFRQIGYHYGPFDLNIIENGQYSVHWPSSHLMPENGVKAHLELKGKYMMPVHWGTFNLSIHDWWEPVERVSKEASEKGVHLLTPRIGQTLSIDENPATSPWWKEFFP
ncbi:MAG: MBL fold metallo-hydrolase, partial [Candidatus Fibromonas sp.]|nr:MBL fold metallo-hydrolase [Candidatus Fibromonas sp.]